MFLGLRLLLGFWQFGWFSSVGFGVYGLWTGVGV